MSGARRQSLYLIASSLVALPAGAAEIDFGAKAEAAIAEALRLPACQVDAGTIPGCYNLIDQMIQEDVGLRPEEAEEVLEEQVDERLQDKATSAETGTAGASPLRDALSRLIAAAGIPGLSENAGELVFGYNVPDGVLSEDVQISIRATAKQPAIYQPLLNAFPEEVREAKKSTLEERLTDFEDVDVELAGSRLSGRWGRDFDFHRSLFQSLWTEAAGSRASRVPDQAGFLALIRRLRCEGDVDPFSATFAQIEADCDLLVEGSAPPSSEELVAGRLLKELVTSVQATTVGFAELVRIAETKGVMEVADLVNNQPQIFLGATYRDRDDELTGPDHVSAEVKWEIGFHNVNGLRRFCRRRGQMRPALDGEEQPTLDCVHAFLYCSKADPTDCTPDRNRARKARRASLSAEYSEIDRYRFSPEEGVDVSSDRSESVKATLAYGWQFSTEADGTGGTRLDVESVYEDVSGDPMKNDRWVGSLTFSQQIGSEAAASISLLWANKPEFLGEVDEDLGARVGLKWTVDPTSD